MSHPRPIGFLPLAVFLGACCAVLAAPPAGAATRARPADPAVASAPGAPTVSIPEPRLVRVAAPDVETVRRLQRGGFDIVSIERGRSVTLLEWPRDAERLAALGLAVEVLDPTPGRTAAARARAELDSRPAPVPKRVLSATGSDGVFRLQSLPPFGSGSMGGYWTLDEIKMKLDDLVASDVDGVVADKLDTLGTTLAGRPIWGLRLGKASSPAVIFNSLTHAREGMSMQTLLYFVDQLLAGYGSDPFATYLLDKREIYVVPVVNPDGYAVNESLYVASSGFQFGLHRKNARDSDNSGTFEPISDGVDINRNYGFRWGKDNDGSSPDPTSEVYRGTAPFSEPETQAQRDLVNALMPATGITFHTYGNLFLQPWGHTDSATVHLDAFEEWDDLITREDAYMSGPGADGLYVTNGDFDDWCYGDTISKPRAFTWTMEIGDAYYGFWAPPSRMLPLAQENVDACFITAALAGPYVLAEGVSIDGGTLDAGYGGPVHVRARNAGLEPTGPGLVGTLVALDPGVQVVIAHVPYPALGSRQSGDPVAPFQVAVDDTVTPGRMARFEVQFTTPGGFFSRDTVRVLLGTPTVVAMDDASSGLGQWSAGSWGIVTGDPDHPSSYFTDSPGGDYYNISANTMLLNAPLDLSAGVHAYALFEARWEIETDYDAMSVDASLDGSTWSRLPATGSTPGSGTLTGGRQVLSDPYYQGTRWKWKPEIADLSAFTGPAGSAVRFRLRLNPYSSTSFYDGFSFDSLRIVVFDPAAQPPIVAVGDAPRQPLALAPPLPNPARGPVRFAFTMPGAGTVRLTLYDLMGRRVRALAGGAFDAGRHVRSWDLRDDGGRAVAPGVYLARLEAGGQSRVRRVVVLEP